MTKNLIFFLGTEKMEEEQKWILGGRRSRKGVYEGEKMKGCVGMREDERTLKFTTHRHKPQNLKDEWEGKRKG